MNRRAGVLVPFLALLMAFAGCLDSTRETGHQDPELVAENAMKAFSAAAGSQDGGDIKSITGSFQAKEGAMEGGEMGFGLSDARLEMAFEWGRGDIVHVTMGMATGGMTFAIEAWCSPTKNLVKWGTTIYESRPTHAGAGHDAEALCGDMDGMEEAPSGLDMFQAEEFDGLELMSLDTHDDGTMSATFRSTDEEGTFTATIDAKGRLSRIEVDTPEGSGAFDIAYGKRGTITLPTANDRLPADISWSTDRADGMQTMTITSSPNLPPLAEIDARLVLRDWENDTTTEVVRFPTGTAGPQTANGYTFTYLDHDGDGRVSENDTFTFSHPDWAGSWWVDESADLFDTWAGKSVNEASLPAVGLPGLLALGVLGLLVAARRR